MFEINSFSKTGCELGEGPVWRSQSQTLTSVDCENKAVLVLDATGKILRRIVFPAAVSACLPCRDKQSMCFLKTGPVLVNLESCPDRPLQDDFIALPHPETHLTDNRYNDAKVGPDGNVWFGSMDDTQTGGGGTLYRMTPDLSVSEIDGDYQITNGPAFSPCGRFVYHTETIGQMIYRFDIGDDGSVTGKTMHIRSPKDGGYPDGMVCDADGNLWVCFFAGHRIARYDAQGVLLAEYKLPVPNVTSCTFGGPALDELFITTARWTLSDEDRVKYPQAGDMFRMKTDTTGLPQPIFAPGPLAETKAF